jgi:Icc-related predicted phosphoesterase
MRILAVSDKVDQLVYSPAIRRFFGDVDLVLGCGDLAAYYLEFIVTMLGGPLFYVVGNHGNEVRERYRPEAEWKYPGGCENIDGRVVQYNGLLLAGLEGSMRYNNSPHFQYTEREMAWKAWHLVPSLLLNKLRYGRFLDILVTHAPPRGVHDRPDLPHRGFGAFVALMERFQPRYLVHGHIHLYTSLEPNETVYQNTTVINAYGHRILDIDEESLR